MNSLTLLGLAAATCTTIAFIPQVVKTWKSKHTKDLSLPMYSFFTFGVGLWLLYGILRVDYPVMIANAFTFAFSCILLYLKIKYK